MKKAKDMCVSAQSNVNGREENGMLTMKKLEETFEGTPSEKRPSSSNRFGLTQFKHEMTASSKQDYPSKATV